MQDLSEAHSGQHTQSTRTNMYAKEVASMLIDVREEHRARLSIYTMPSVWEEAFEECTT